MINTQQIKQKEPKGPVFYFLSGTENAQSWCPGIHGFHWEFELSSPWGQERLFVVCGTYLAGWGVPN